ncbi:MAG: efflux RND transporter periplasmic adaptor subunit [Deltaproteobacteria bacterium]|nr:efflux RND transporter periplasmic adaptor subunit [Deltaproteobacteria bacterium]MBW1952187.1 efflux RND transporter periplasmic adaptor subunit [Deltaproteobacteria bacterium]MBW1985721.1 efflux RND transporter periplasmic adaptor subunit [Deltaproteobacteria bacterium]MBW2134634.1 efflux RND transporter periplasmic adaptor subunit [Deltaproteobacteria bacterium]
MKPNKKIVISVLGGLLLLGLAGSLLYRWWYALPEGLLVASGRIEGDEVVIAPKIAGKVILVNKDKGDPVEPGELLARLDSDQITAQLQRAQKEADYWQKQVEQAGIDLDYTERHVQASITESRARVGALAARVVEAEAIYVKNRLDYDRYRSLFSRQVVPKQRLDQVTSAYQASRASLQASRQELQLAQAQLQQARLLLKTVEMKRQAYEAVQASFAAARAAVQEAQANLHDTYIYSPSRGTILTKEVEPGEVVNPGTPLFTMVNMDKLFLKVYINEPDIGKIRLGQEARIYVDAFPDRAFKAQVSRVAQRAEFTPKYVETRAERVKLVFAVELLAKNPEGYLKPGMPGDGVIRVQEGVPWQRPR